MKNFLYFVNVPEQRRSMSGRTMYAAATSAMFTDEKDALIYQAKLSLDGITSELSYIGNARCVNRTTSV